MKTIHIDDGDALNIDCVVVNKVDSKNCKCFYSCDLIDQYEQKLKADLVDLLEEINIKINELYSTEINHTATTIQVLIQEKINALKGGNDESDVSDKRL